MKKILMLLFVICFTFTSCGKKEEGKKDENIFKDVIYSVVHDQQGENSLSAFLMKKTNPDTILYNMEINKYSNYKYEEWKANPDKIDIYPARFDSSSVKDRYDLDIVLPNDIHIVITSYPDYYKEFRSFEKMKKMMLLFDLKELGKLTEEKIPNSVLSKYIPKFDIKK